MAVVRQLAAGACEGVLKQADLSNSTRGTSDDCTPIRYIPSAQILGLAYQL